MPRLAFTFLLLTMSALLATRMIGCCSAAITLVKHNTDVLRPLAVLSPCDPLDNILSE